jgi:protein required for attachment to host cells
MPRWRASSAGNPRSSRWCGSRPHPLAKPPARRRARRREQHQRFAREIAQHLDEALAAGKFGSLLIFSSNPFIGDLCAPLSHGVIGRVQNLLDQDLSHVGITELERRIAVPSDAMP